MRSKRPFLRLTPRARGRTWKDYVIVPLVLVTVGPFVLAYKLFVGWWLNPLLTKRYERELQEKVRADLAFLFLDFDGRFVPNERPDKYASVVIVEVADLRVVISEHHGDYGISVARRDIPQGGESLDSILGVIYEREGSSRRPEYASLKELGKLFREKFDQVQMALSEERCPDTVAAIDRRHRQGMQRMAREFNRPDGFFDADVVNPSDLTKEIPK